MLGLVVVAVSGWGGWVWMGVGGCGCALAVVDTCLLCLAFCGAQDPAHRGGGTDRGVETETFTDTVTETVEKPCGKTQRPFVGVEE